jgi:hypothetical protein
MTSAYLASRALELPAAPAPVVGRGAANVARPAILPIGQTDKQLIVQSVKTFVRRRTLMAGIIDPSTKRIESSVNRALIHHVYIDLARGPLTAEEKIFASNTLRGELGF